MPKRPQHQRQADEFKTGRIAPWPTLLPPPKEVAQRVQYIASGEHKNYPSPNGLWTFAPKADKAKCAHFAEASWWQLQEALRAAIIASCVHEEFRGEFPRRAWAFINNVLHEARLSNQENGAYHGFPLQYEEQWPDDPDGLLRNAPRVTVTVD